MLFLLFVAFCSFVVPALFSVFLCVVVTVFKSCPLCILFSYCVVMLAFWSPSTAAHFAFCFTNCGSEVASGPMVTLVG